MYWKAIGTSVRAVYEHTYLYNRLWGHPIYPLGQTYGGAGPQVDPALPPLRRELRRTWRRAGGTGRRRRPPAGRALGAEITDPILGYRPITSHPLLKSGSKGDLVVWAQEHLRTAGEQVPVTGIFGKVTRAAVRDFQSKNAASRSTA